MATTKQQKKSGEEVFSSSTEIEETMNMKQDIPNSTHEALQEQHWRKAIEEELHSLNQNNVWTLVSLPTVRKRLVVVGISQLSTVLMVKSRGTRHGS